MLVIYGLATAEQEGAREHSLTRLEIFGTVPIIMKRSYRFESEEANEPWVHVIVGDMSCEEAEVVVANKFPVTGISCMLNGEQVGDMRSFYSAVIDAVPLINSCGRNLNALIDLFRTFGWGHYSGRVHTFIWYHPEVMKRFAAGDFGEVLDIIIGVSKELLVGEELDPNFDPFDEDDWVSTRLQVVFVCENISEANSILKMAKQLSDDWSEDFRSLSIPVTLSVI